MRSAVVVLLSLGVSGLAWAGAKPAPADKDHYVDESTVWFQIANGDKGYWVQGGGSAPNLQEEDKVRLVVKAKGKTLDTIDCRHGNQKEEPGVLNAIKCEGTNKNLTATGPLEADLILKTDADDKEYLLRTFKVNAKHWDNVEWQIEADDLLAAAYMAPRDVGEGEQPLLRFWVANNALTDLTMQCTVDGKSIPEISGFLQDDATITADILKGNKRTTWHWTHVEFRPQNWSVKKHAARISLEEHPGNWDCNLRLSGTTFREFKFNVGSGGAVAAHPMQSAKDAPLLGPNVSQIDVRIPKDNGVDQRIKPDVLKKSRGFGLAWQQHDSVKALLAALPPAYENQAPVAVKPKGSGKMIVGAQASPPRFIDYSTSLVRAQSVGSKGYQLYVNQNVGGVPLHKSNAYRAELKQGGKLTATLKCTWSNGGDEEARMRIYGMSDAATVECGGPNDITLTAKGPMDISVIMSDDTDGNEYLLGTYHVTVQHLTSYGDPVWQIIPDDVLATAWIRQGEGATAFRFWIANEKASNFTLRCMAAGAKFDDIKLTNNEEPQIQAEVRKSQNSDTVKYQWTKIDEETITPRVVPGLPTKKDEEDNIQRWGSHPGKWDCDVRWDGKVVRKLLFTVNAKGYIDPDPTQVDPAYPLMPEVVPVELRFGKDIVDVRVRPDAMKKSRGFGLPWPKAPTKPFPPASGLPDPK